MITALEFSQGGLKQLHGNLDKQLDGLTPEQLTPSRRQSKANTIAGGSALRAHRTSGPYISEQKTPLGRGAMRRRRAAETGRARA